MRIVMFSSGDFALPTFRRLLDGSEHEVVGLVTSNDKVMYNDERLYDVAKRNNIPTYVPDDLESDGFIRWLIERHADVFCVISYKKLPTRVLDVVDGTAFNVHASYLPFLRGAAPINWAIRLGFKQTGLTSSLLSDKLDQGDIIVQKIVDCDESTFDSLFIILSLYCVNVTLKTLELMASDSFIARKQIDVGVNSDLLNAPKVNADYFRITKYVPIQKLIRSVPMRMGIPCTIHVKGLTEEDRIDRSFNARIYDVREVPIRDNCHDWCSDGKTYLEVFEPLLSTKAISIRRIKVEGRKEMDIGKFLNGFRYFGDRKKYRVYVTLGTL